MLPTKYLQGLHDRGLLIEISLHYLRPHIMTYVISGMLFWVFFFRHASFTKLARVTVLQFCVLFSPSQLSQPLSREFSFLCIFIGFLVFYVKVFYAVLQVAALLDKLVF
jgi:hypothetical protein